MQEEGLVGFLHSVCSFICCCYQFTIFCTNFFELDKFMQFEICLEQIFIWHFLPCFIDYILQLCILEFEIDGWHWDIKTKKKRRKNAHFERVTQLNFKKINQFYFRLNLSVICYESCDSFWVTYLIDAKYHMRWLYSVHIRYTVISIVWIEFVEWGFLLVRFSSPFFTFP